MEPLPAPGEGKAVWNDPPSPPVASGPDASPPDIVIDPPIRIWLVCPPPAPDVSNQTLPPRPSPLVSIAPEKMMRWAAIRTDPPGARMEPPIHTVPAGTFRTRPAPSRLPLRTRSPPLTLSVGLSPPAVMSPAMSAFPDATVCDPDQLDTSVPVSGAAGTTGASGGAFTPISRLPSEMTSIFPPRPAVPDVEPVTPPPSDA